MGEAYSGVDYQGNRRECEVMDPDTMCSQEVTESDLYASECERLDYKTVVCACHDWICLR